MRRFDLPPMAECQSTTTWLTRRHRGQAPSHMDYAVSVRMGLTADPPARSHPPTPPLKQWNTVNVGGGLPPMAECQSTTTWLTHRHREQAPSHRGYAVSVRMGFIGDPPAYSHPPTPPAPKCCPSRSSACNCGYMTKCHLPRRSIGGIRSMWEGACPR